MGLRFKKSIKIAPGVKLNFGKKSTGISFGTKGYHYSLNSRGKRTTTIGIPGTGLSYTSTSSGSKKSSSRPRKHKSTTHSQKSQDQLYKQQKKLIELEENELEVQEYEKYITSIQNIHQECDPSMDWNDISHSKEPFPKGEIGPEEKLAIEKHNNFSPSLLEKFFTKKADKRKDLLESKILEAKNEDLKLYQEWEENVAFANRILAGDIDAYYDAIALFNPFEKLTEFGSGFEFGTDSADIMEIEFVVKSTDVIPQRTKSLTKTGKLSEKNLTKTAYYDITQDYICSCSIRLARELFALLPLKKVLVHATDYILNTVTGHYEELTILSVLFTRERFEDTNFDKIDASDFTESFEHKMKFKKTTGFYPVDRL